MLGLVCLLVSCNSGSKESSSSLESTKTSSKSSKQNSYDCLKDYEDSYDKLITKEEMASVYSIPFSEAKEDLSGGSYGEYSFQWESDRPGIPMTISGITVDAPDRNTIGIHNLSFSSEKSSLESVRSTFDMGYKELSDAELKQIEENLKNASKEVQESGAKLMETRKKMVWEAVDDLGSSAWYKWGDQYGGELVILAGRTKFQIRLKISQDSRENLEVAKKLARLVLDKC